MKRKHPWFIWLSFIGLAWFSGRVSFEYRSERMTKWPDEKVNRWLGWCRRLIGSVLAGVILPIILAGCFIKPFCLIRNILVVPYIYLAGVFITNYLYNWHNRNKLS